MKYLDFRLAAKGVILLHAKHRCIVYQTDQTGLISAASVWGDQYSFSCSDMTLNVSPEFGLVTVFTYFR